ncbi:MAG: ABC transporter substrate-binding protein [Candidatus Rokuibacteriota bacterium]|nr:MAG: ABC transporter substrate-binding protein [Candidatus Rokubacteria bacterium]
MKRAPLALVTVVLSVLSGLALAPAFAQAPRPPIKIGFLTVLTGGLAAGGKEMEQGFRLALDEVRGEIEGRKITLLVEDDEAKPDVGLTKARKLVESNHVHMVAGLLHSGVSLAVGSYMAGKETPLVVTNAIAKALTQEKRAPNVFRTSWAGGQAYFPFGQYVVEKLRYRRLIVAYSDFAAGQDMAGGFTPFFTAAGGEVVDTVKAPLGTPDFAPYLAKIVGMVGTADAVWAWYPGADAIRFVKQYVEFGLKEKMPLIAGGSLVEEINLPAQGKDALGIISADIYTPTWDTPENRAFVAAFQKKYSVTGAKVILAALKAVNGQIEDRPRFLEALRKVEITTGRGPIRFDQHQNAILNVQIRQVREVGGKIENVVLEVIPNVDQYWKTKR